MKTISYIGLFITIQLVSLVLTGVGLLICALGAWITPNRATKSRVTGLPILSFNKWFWLWSNDEDGIYPTWYARVNSAWSYERVIFVWTALRNPCNNLRFVPGVSNPGRPLYYRAGLIKGKPFYLKMGWEAKTGWPSLSAGSGTGF